MNDDDRSIPAEARRAIVTALGAFMRQADAGDLPRSLRAFRNFRNKALFEKDRELVAALDDEVLRKRILEWLDGKPGIPSKDTRALRIAVERRDGWERELAATTPAREAKPRAQADSESSRKLGEARERLKDAKAELREARKSVTETKSKLARERADLEKELGASRAETTRLRGELKKAARDVGAARQDFERAGRRARKDLARVETERDVLKGKLRELRTENAELRRKLERGEVKARKPQPATSRKTEARPRVRRALTAPKGLLGDARETLEHWLSQQSVTLLVDGYNVTKQERGFGRLDLESQRDRLISELQRVVTKYPNAAVIVVFDGSEVSAGTGRRKKGSVRVEYSRSGETADDHIVARLAELPPEPVVLVTSDKELQQRAAAQAATIATSPQLLQVLNKA